MITTKKYIWLAFAVLVVLVSGFVSVIFQRQRQTSNNIVSHLIVGEITAIEEENHFFNFLMLGTFSITIFNMTENLKIYSYKSPENICVGDIVLVYYHYEYWCPHAPVIDSYEIILGG